MDTGYESLSLDCSYKASVCVLVVVGLGSCIYSTIVHLVLKNHRLKEDCKAIGHGL